MTLKRAVNWLKNDFRPSERARTANLPTDAAETQHLLPVFSPHSFRFYMLKRGNQQVYSKIFDEFLCCARLSTFIVFSEKRPRV